MKHLSLTVLSVALSMVLAVSLGLASTQADAPNYTKASIKQGIRHRLYNGTSTNWAGYAVETNLTSPQSNAVSDAYGQWVVPTVTCSQRNTSYSASWVGIDGYSDQTVEQTGTEHDCNRGRPQYYAWFEFYPQYMYEVNLPVNPGNHMSADVKYANNEFTLTLTNMTMNRVFTTSSSVPGAQRESAEWITEAPSSFFGVLPLANFGTENFSNTTVTMNGVTAPISGPTTAPTTGWAYDPVSMVVSARGPAKALLSTLGNNGSSFSVSWLHD